MRRGHSSCCYTTWEETRIGYGGEEGEWRRGALLSALLAYLLLWHLTGSYQDTPAGFGGQGNRVSVEEGWRETWDRGREGHSRWFAKELEMGLGIGFGGKEGE